AERAADARRLDAQAKQIFVTPCALLQRIQRRADLGFVARGTELLDLRDLRRSHLRIVDLEDVVLFFLFEAVAVHADDSRFTRVDLGGARRGGFLDAML